MIRTASFKSETDLARYLNANGMDTKDLYSLFQNASGWWSVFHEDGTGSRHIKSMGSAAGVSAATDTVTTAGALLTVGNLHQEVSAEDLGTATGGVLNGTLANVYVIPHEVRIYDSVGQAPAVVDDGLGGLWKENDRTARMGAIDYRTGVFEIQYPYGSRPAGTVLADYEASLLPDAADLPTRARLSAMVITAAGTGTLSWALYEDAAMANAPLLVGSGALVDGMLHYDFGGLLSCTLDLDNRGARWLWIVPPDDGTVTARITWERPY